MAVSRRLSAQGAPLAAAAVLNAAATTQAGRASYLLHSARATLHTTALDDLDDQGRLGRLQVVAFDNHQNAALPHILVHAARLLHCSGLARAALDFLLCLSDPTRKAVFVQNNGLETYDECCEQMGLYIVYGLSEASRFANTLKWVNFYSDFPEMAPDPKIPFYAETAQAGKCVRDLSIFTQPAWDAWAGQEAQGAAATLREARPHLALLGNAEIDAFAEGLAQALDPMIQTSAKASAERYATSTSSRRVSSSLRPRVIARWLAARLCLGCASGNITL